MGMSEYKFTDQEIKTLIQQRDNQNNQRIRERFIAILMRVHSKNLDWARHSYQSKIIQN